MTREEARKAAEVMLAYADGKKIEFLSDDGWTFAPNPSFSWNDEAVFYRIKPETKYRPFKDAEECWQEMQEHQPFGWIIYKMKPTVIRSIASLYDDGVEPYDACNSSYKEALQIFTFADGQPFGVKEENI